MLYLPMIFTIYGILLGSVYFQTNSPTSILSAFGVYSCASALFMFPAIYTYLYRAVEVGVVRVWSAMLVHNIFIGGVVSCATCSYRAVEVGVVRGVVDAGGGCFVIIK